MVCPHCSRVTRPGKVCEWCDQPLPAATGAVAEPTVTEPAVTEPPTAAPVREREPLIPRTATVQELESVSPRDPPAHGPGEPIVAERTLSGAPTWAERLADAGVDRDTLPILILILIHVLVSVIRGGFTLYSLPIALWIFVGLGVVGRRSWSMALAMVLVCLEIAFALFGIGPEVVAGLPSWAPIDFLMTFLRIVTGFLIVRLKDQLV